MFSQEARVFNETPLNVNKCRDVLAKIIRAVRGGNQIPDGETTDLFFAVSKLFQHRDPNLRQLVHLVVRELAEITEDVIMITSSVMKDTVGGTELIFRPNAVRNLCRVIDLSTVQAIERSLKTAMNDKTYSVSSAGIVSCYHLYIPSPDTSRRVLSEAQDCIATFSGTGAMGIFSAPLASSSPQYQALGLLLLVKKNDRNGLTKLLQSYQRGDVLRNQFAVVLLIRLAGELVRLDSQTQGSLVGLLKGWAEHKSELISLEALRTLAGIGNLKQADALDIIKTLSPHVHSNRNIVKIMSLRILKLLAKTFPGIVTPFNRELENYIGLGNKVISTLAIAILLQTGSEDSVERLVSQVKTFIPDISDEFRLFIVDSLEELSVKFPKQTGCIISLLSSILREEGSSAFKERIILSFGKLIKYAPETRAEILLQLCEFMEDCEYPKLAILVLNILATESQHTRRTGPFVRYIYNRIVLENSNVRSASVAALCTICSNGVELDPLYHRSIYQLLEYAADDSDDEVRDRALAGMKTVNAPKLSSGSDDTIEKLENHLEALLNAQKPVDLRLWKPVRPVGQAPLTHESFVSGSRTVERNSLVALCQQFPMIQSLGDVWHSSPPVALTEEEAEYVLDACKYTFSNHCLLHVRVRNTLPDNWLRDASLVCTPTHMENGADGTRMEQLFSTNISLLGPGETKDLVIAFRFTGSDTGVATSGMYPLCRILNTLKFTSTDNAEEPHGFGDEFQVEPITFGVADYLAINERNEEKWESQAKQELKRQLKTSRFKNVTDARIYLSRRLGLDVETNRTTADSLSFGCTLPTNIYIGVQIQMVSFETGVAFQIIARSDVERATRFVTSGLVQLLKF